MGAIFGFTGDADPQLLARMRETLAHRGEQFESHVTPYGTIGFLAQLTSAERDMQGGGLDGCGLNSCGLDADGDRAVALAGFLTWRGPDSKTLLATAETIVTNPEFANRLSGDFVMAILDRKALHLVRDGSGARTVYYGRHDGRLFFASEPKAIWNLPGFPRRLRAASLAQYLTFSFVPGQATMLRDIEELPAGHVLKLVGSGQIELYRYFIFEDVVPSPTVSDCDWVGRFRATLAESVARRMPKDGPVTVFLSGGLDSSVVTAEVARQSSRRVRSFALHFGDKYPNELPYAAAVAKRCGTDHEEVLLQPGDFLPRLREMIWHLDDPIGDPITMPNFELASRVAQYSRWVFNGEGGDPCFGGPKNIPMLLGHWYGGLSRDARFREKAYLASYRRGYEELARLLTPAVRREIDQQRDLEQLLTPFFDCERPQLFLDKLTAINIRMKGAHLILPKVERMLAASGLVPLSPLFSSEMVQLSFQIPTTLKLRGGIEKVIMKRAYVNDLPKEVIDRPKSGMRVPVHYWFQGELKRYARHILRPRELRRAGIFDPVRVKQLLNYRTNEGPGRYGLRIWMLLTFEIWRRVVIEREAV